MSDLGENVARAREHVAPAWTKERERAVRTKLAARLELRQRRRVVATSFAALALVVSGLFGWHRLSLRSSAGSTASATNAASTTQRARVASEPRGAGAEAPLPVLLGFADGSSVTALSADARAEAVEVRADAVTVRLVSGAARFSVTPNPARTFRVLARDATVTVLGTVFTVGLQPSHVRVSVERGRVHVEWAAFDRILGVGEEVVTSEEGRTPAPAPVIGDAEPPPAEHAAHVTGTAPPSTQPSWRGLAQDGDFSAAFARMATEGPAGIRDDAGDLLLAADVARLGGHPEKAIGPLERVLSAHVSDSRAPLAAFTLGRTLLDQLGRPHEAGRAFARARKLDPGGALAQDALAREVESCARAGDVRAARDRSEEYATLYPNGRRLKAVRRLGGLD